MKRRILSILLCLSMMLTAIVATSCGTTTGDSKETETGEGVSLARSSMTLTLWIPVGEGTTEESLELVEEAINEVTQAKFDTAIKLYGVPTDEYEAVMEKQMADIQERIEKSDQEAIDRAKAEREAAKKGETLGPEWYTSSADEIENTNDLIVDSAAGYPHVEKNQMDIFLIRDYETEDEDGNTVTVTGYETYKNYVENALIVSLDEELAGSSKKLSSYIYPHFLTSVKSVNGSVYAIPNNRAIGEYKWIVANGEAAEALGYSEKDLANIAVNKNDLDAAKTTDNFVKKLAEKYPKLAAVYGEIPTRYMQYFSNGSTDEFSAIAAYVTNATTVESVAIKNVLEISQYTDVVYLNEYFESNGYVNNDIDPEKDDFGFAIIEASESEIEAYRERGYYCSVYEYPVVSVEECCSSMFAISSYTKSTSRAMEILTYLNTEEDSIRTILQYGKENTHWKRNEANTNMIVKLDDTYNMNINETGNVYMTYPDYGVEVDFTQPTTNWTDAKEANKQSVFPVTIGFTGYSHEENAELLAELDALNVDITKKLKKLKFETYAEFETAIKELAEEIDDDDAFAKLTFEPTNSANSNKTEANGWVTNNSISYLWSQYANPEQ